jgi:hypothetical protein
MTSRMAQKILPRFFPVRARSVTREVRSAVLDCAVADRAVEDRAVEDCTVEGDAVADGAGLADVELEGFLMILPCSSTENRIAHSFQDNSRSHFGH